ncbi:HlyD family efflux transporter periplasmic adaptor subunit [Jidongwangia harbinensis]|uniref:HlyD family efflux transporter periplasmic adaptor subunit n=1 Tax=Jidongwangia harbinensis TaxID=2878561 RepID=UPI001CDA2A73|nr:HlyD family efflux transporter periplasmic adaptor subunit [Jidongwangia harbinensis]
MTTPPQSAPSPAPAAPARPARRAALRKWRARLIVLLLLAAAVLLFLRISNERATDANVIDIGTVTLTAQAIPVETPRPGQVTAVSVVAQQRVTAGQRLGTVEVTSIDSEGEPVVSTVVLEAPRAGIVVDEPVTVGSTLQPGQPFVELYDPSKLTFYAEVPVENLSEIGAGMAAELTAKGREGTVRAVVQRVVPVVQSDVESVAAGSLRLVLLPARGQDVGGLIPGMRYTGTVDTLTGVPGRPRLVPGG